MNDPADIRAWQRLSDRVTTSGILTARDPARLSAMGVRHVINLALADHPETLADEGALLAEQGITYTHIPVPFDAPDETHYRAFAAALERAERAGPVHVHCVMNWRVSAFFYRWHRDACGMAEGEARTLMERQWSPENNGHPDAPAWAAFVKGES